MPTDKELAADRLDNLAERYRVDHDMDGAENAAALARDIRTINEITDDEK